jgi:hypothetical protein
VPSISAQKRNGNILAREWRGVSRRTALLVAAAMFILVSSTFVIAAVGKMGQQPV